MNLIAHLLFSIWDMIFKTKNTFFQTLSLKNLGFHALNGVNHVDTLLEACSTQNASSKF